MSVQPPAGSNKPYTLDPIACAVCANCGAFRDEGPGCCLEVRTVWEVFGGPLDGRRFSGEEVAYRQIAAARPQETR